MNQVAPHSVTAVTKLCREIGVVSQLRNLNIPAEAIDHMAAGAMKVTRLLNNNPREVTLDDAIGIYQSAY
jgi:alcohol dehydrogenase class IV